MKITFTRHGNRYIHIQSYNLNIKLSMVGPEANDQTARWNAVDQSAQNKLITLQ